MKPSTMRPMYARYRGEERFRHRSVALLLTLVCLGLACRSRDTPPPRRLPAPQPAAHEKPVDVKTEPSSRPAAVAPKENSQTVPAQASVDEINTASLLPSTEVKPRVAPQELGPLVLRVGLATDLERVKLPCCDPRMRIFASTPNGDLDLALDKPTTVRPAKNIGRTAVYRLQVAALKDEQQAKGVAEYLGTQTRHPAEAVFDATSDLYRVRVGEFADRESAEQVRGQLATLGVEGAWVVSEGGELDNAAFDIVRGDKAWHIPGRYLELRTSENVGLPYGRTRYRGKLLLFLSSRGLLNVINEIELESYLRGVVPKEMGPELYNQIEALKAQTVAARTYTLRNLGEFEREGYDICSTPRCQVYAGMAVEHPVTDRAIRETDGQVVLFENQPAETFYSATCGGHTENVETVFPLKTGAYLRGVPCVEAGVTTLQGNASLQGAARAFPSGLMEMVLPRGRGTRPQILAARLGQLAVLASLPQPRDQLASLERREVLRFVASIFDVALDRRLTANAGRVQALLVSPPDDWRFRDMRLANFLRSSGYLEGARPKGGGELSSLEVDDLLLELAIYLGVLSEQRGHFLKLENGTLSARVGSERPEYAIPANFATFRRRGSTIKASSLDLMAGDRMWLYQRRGKIVAIVQPVDAPPLNFGKRAPKRAWQVWKSDQDLRAAVQKRYPGFPFKTFEVLERGVSGRVGKMALIGESGERLEVEGLAVRWTLDVWDTLFWAERKRSKNGDNGWFFKGRGWGHGVGMSQAGAFGMAVRGSSYREILEHYYTGIRLGRLKPVAPRPRFNPAPAPLVSAQ